jgi:hypothetical protein
MPTNLTLIYGTLICEVGPYIKLLYEILLKKTLDSKPWKDALGVITMSGTQ